MIITACLKLFRVTSSKWDSIVSVKIIILKPVFSTWEENSWCLTTLQNFYDGPALWVFLPHFWSYVSHSIGSFLGFCVYTSHFTFDISDFRYGNIIFHVAIILHIFIQFSLFVLPVVNNSFVLIFLIFFCNPIR